MGLAVSSTASNLRSFDVLVSVNFALLTKATDLEETWQAQSVGTMLFGPRYHLARPTLILLSDADS